MTAVPPTSTYDPNSFANNHEVVATHNYLDLYPDFERKSLVGFADITLQALIEQPTTVTLDARTLVIKEVKMIIDIHSAEHTEKKEVELFDYYISGEKEVSEAGYPQAYGQPLTIRLPQNLRENIKKGDKFTIRVIYNTLPVSEAVQWCVFAYIC
jgi:hypothetical protein